MQFPIDCQALAKAQCIYAHQLKSLGVVDTIIWESDMSPSAVADRETYKSFPLLKSRIHSFLVQSLQALNGLTEEQLITQRYNKYRALGTYTIMPEVADRTVAIEAAKKVAVVKAPVVKNANKVKR